jgi:hypothetical protein
LPKATENAIIQTTRKKAKGKKLITKYTTEIEAAMKMFFESLSEKDRRRYAAVESLKLGNGGQQYMCSVLGCDPGTIKKGFDEINGGLSAEERIRKQGGGKKKS